MTPLSNSDRQRRHRAKKRKATKQCPYCQGWLWGKYAVVIGWHQGCYPSGYMREYRKLKGESDD